MCWSRRLLLWTSFAALATPAASLGCAVDKGGEPAQSPKDAGVDAPMGLEVSGAPLCVNYCTYLRSCLEPICDAAALAKIFPTKTSCADQCGANPDFQKSIPDLLKRSCDGLRSLSCSQLEDVSSQCICKEEVPAETNAGAACVSDDQCEGGKLPGSCIPEEEEEGARTGFHGGYCVARGCLGSGDCGEVGICVSIGGEQQCMAQCDKSEQCRGGYACWPSNGETGFCLPACGGEIVCSSAGTVCIEGVCVPPPVCDGSAPCPQGLNCDFGVCSPITCEETEDCAEGLVCANGICN